MIPDSENKCAGQEKVMKEYVGKRQQPYYYNLWQNYQLRPGWQVTSVIQKHDLNYQKDFN